MFTEADRASAAALVEALASSSYRVATAESCTGGLIAGLLTEVSGSSAVVDCGFVTYSNEAKTQLIGVPAELIGEHGAVSEPVARAMVAGALANAPLADVAVAVTGVAGPTGGTAEKPVGLVHIAAASRAPDTVVHQRMLYNPTLGRIGIRLATVRDALALLKHAANLSDT